MGEHTRTAAGTATSTWAARARAVTLVTAIAFASTGCETVVEGLTNSMRPNGRGGVTIGLSDVIRGFNVAWKKRQATEAQQRQAEERAAREREALERQRNEANQQIEEANRTAAETGAKQRETVQYYAVPVEGGYVIVDSRTGKPVDGNVYTVPPSASQGTTDKVEAGGVTEMGGKVVVVPPKSLGV